MLFPVLEDEIPDICEVRFKKVFLVCVLLVGILTAIKKLLNAKLIFGVFKSINSNKKHYDVKISSEKSIRKIVFNSKTCVPMLNKKKVYWKRDAHNPLLYLVYAAPVTVVDF